MKYIGAHVSISGGIENAPLNAQKIRAKAFAMFTKNQRQWKAKPLTEKNILDFQSNLKNINISINHVLPHDSYLINLAHPDHEKKNISLDAFIDEIKRVEALGLKYLNFHPGNHLNLISEAEGISNIVESLNIAIDSTDSVELILETTAGQGSSIGYQFFHLRDIAAGIKNQKRIGVCVDTCHIFAAGYQIHTKEGYEKTWKSFNNEIGFSLLKGIHLNDSKSSYGSRVDRHHSIGKGNLGKDFFTMFMNDKRFNDIPIILETIDDSIWKEEIEFLYSLSSDKTGSNSNHSID